MSFLWVKTFWIVIKLEMTFEDTQHYDSQNDTLLLETDIRSISTL